MWMLTGDFSPQRPDLLPKGFWSHMLTLGTTWHINTEKNWALERHRVVGRGLLASETTDSKT
jgi:hypothetical protein